MRSCLLHQAIGLPPCLLVCSLCSVSGCWHCRV